ncbi:hypothetical protein RI844_05700 [Thalassotalea fonticola]|uniref:Dystroglycan-type cadherin-like domain-containing protein n=1 Tax=Thalassotalea fonticola TaxID=3065649 RepID=A0ABZ0GSW7_9GAMM|nr:hypothetical protein RI844_05700 [Colwelliaceae bacterium S1-1]
MLYIQLLKRIKYFSICLILSLLSACSGGSSEKTEPELTLNHAPTTPTITNTNATEGVLFRELLLATDADNDDLIFTKVSAESWLAVVNGELVGTPATTDIGVTSVVIEVTDGQASRQNTLSINVAAKNSTELYVNENIRINDWQYASTDSVSLVAAAQLSGEYAIANNELIEIRDIRQNLLNSITSSEIEALLPGADLSEDNAICAMSFTPSGRFLYLGICTKSSDVDKDAILAYNTNTKVLSVFDRLTISADNAGTKRYGMTFFKGELFVGSENGLYRYDATRNAVADTKGDQPIGNIVATDSAVTGLTIDMPGQTLYLTTKNSLYRSAIDTVVLDTIAVESDIQALTFARTYGSSSTEGLYLLKNDGIKASVLMISTDDLRGEKDASLSLYSEFSADLADIAATADGKMLLANTKAAIIHDVTDTRLDFDAWLKDELSQYVSAIKSLTSTNTITGGNNLVPEGFLTRKIVAADQSPSTSPIADNVGWAIYLLMAADKVSPDADIEPLIELLIKRHAGLHPDTLGGVKTVDGHFVRNYESNGNVSNDNAQPQVYISMKFIPAVYKAAEFYPDNDNIQAYKEYLRQTMKRASDTIRAEQRITWTNDKHGPILVNNKMSNETWLYGDIGAAQDPFATQDYAEYVYSRTKMNYSDWLLNEPVIRASHSAFIIMGGTMILRHHFDDPDWNEQNRNYYAATRAAGDDLGAPYFAAFSAGNNPEKSGNYYNDGPSDHPGNIIHFPAVLGLGQLGWTAPVVGGYMAYRDGLRQEMLNSSTEPNLSMLTRWSMTDASYVMPSVGIADFWYGALGLVETIDPGVLAEIRDEFYLPKLVESTSLAGNVELHYSKITPRRVIGIDTEGNETSLGFQLSPFELATGENYSEYKAIDPEGELLELNDVISATPRFINSNFENGLTGWSQLGNATFGSSDNDNSRIVGASAEIKTNATVLVAEASLRQTLELSLDLDNTRYIIRGNGLISTTDAPGHAYLHLAWDNDNNADNGTLTDQSSNFLDDNNRRVEFVNTTSKPVGATHLHLSFVVEPLAIGEYRYLFDDLSIVRLGASSPLINGDFENGMTGWLSSASEISLTSDPEKVLKGTNSLRFSLGQGDKNWKSLSTELDVSNDREGTRYIFRLATKVITMRDSDFEILIDVYDDAGEKIITRNDVGDILPATSGDITFTFRKRPNDARYVITFRMKRNSKSSAGTDEIIIDDFRLDKEQLF